MNSFAGDHDIEIPYQIGKCHERIQHFSRGRIPFRAPGGAWTSPKFTKIANRLPFADRYIGRYGWDIDAADWRLHRKIGNPDKIDFGEFCRRFEQAIAMSTRGIILLHDGFPQEVGGARRSRQNKVIQVTEFVIEAMRKRGLRFIPLKEPSASF